MDIILIIIMSLLLAAFLFFKLGDIFSPWTITTVIWLAIEVMFLFQGDLLDPLGNQFHSCLALWLPIFCASALVTYYVLPRGHTGQTLSDIPDIIQRFHNLEGEENRQRTEQSFFVPKQEIVDNDYDLSINKYKKTEYVPVEYPPTGEILQKIEDLEAEIQKELAELKVLLEQAN